jgi:hypothetical protein
VLRHEGERTRYRRIAYPSIDLEAVTNILEGTIDSLEMKGERQQAQRVRSTMADVHETRRLSEPAQPAKPRSPSGVPPKKSG